ncbi:unnamed protein product [Psylliodes chrysocephalus]|uniref:Uncharacterized protein n=1 Tax=Psylliodes chrysocephalus TaxID=3402493 RepID=A0A9P0D859_9CUCU|nr:unnamed protein product [Psylliodes chrysocephala]
MFTNTLSIGYKTVQYWVNNSSHGMTFKNTSVSMSQAVSSRYSAFYEFINKFFDELPKLSAHYCRWNSAKVYLENTFNSMMDFYKVYKETCRSQNQERKQNKDQYTCFSYKYENVSEQSI